jgi:dGTPase
LVEAADDICYSIVDVEDGHRMGYISFEQAKDLLNKIADIDIQKDDDSKDEKVKRLRAKAIDKLIREATQIFLEHEVKILSGEFEEDLLSLSDYAEHLKEIGKQTSDTVFQHQDVVSIQVAGYEVLAKLFTEFANTIFNNNNKSKLVYQMLPKEYHLNLEDDSYEKILKITDYISGMTDSYATKLFQKFSGISLG